MLSIEEIGTRTLHTNLAGRRANDQCALVIKIREPLMFDGRGLNSLERDKNRARRIRMCVESGLSHVSWHTKVQGFFAFRSTHKSSASC